MVFAVALTTITVLVAVVGGYVVSSPGWGRRWYRRRATEPPDGGADQA